MCIVCRFIQVEVLMQKKQNKIDKLKESSCWLANIKTAPTYESFIQ